MRYKGVDTEIKDNTLIIEYQTQEDITNSDVDKFIKSIMPSIKYILQNIDNSITEIKIYMFDRANHRFNKSFIVSEDKNINNVNRIINRKTKINFLFINTSKWKYIKIINGKNNNIQK